VRAFARKSGKVRCAELLERRPTLMPDRQAALRTSTLVMALAFPHHAAQEKTAHDARRDSPAGCVQIENEERCGGE
jgi:hypothetical protein